MVSTSEGPTGRLAAHSDSPWSHPRCCAWLFSVSFDDDWADDAAHKEASAHDRDLQARKARWAKLDRADLQGAGKSTQRARRSERWRKTWPWLVFFAIAAVLMVGSRLLGFE